MKFRFRWHISVLIPARNEEELLPACLMSVFAAKAALGEVATTDIIVVSDRSNDRTPKIAAGLLKKHGMVVRIDAGVVGTARRTAAATAMSRYDGPQERWWLASTDADCVVPSFWLTEQLRLANQGVEALAGTVGVLDFAGHTAQVPELFRNGYLVAADGSHSHVHGANLGMRADVYVRAGGWAPLATAEDHDLWRRLRRAGAIADSTNRTQVITSGRRVGRAPLGFAAALAAHNERAS